MPPKSNKVWSSPGGTPADDKKAADAAPGDVEKNPPNANAKDHEKSTLDDDDVAQEQKKGATSGNSRSEGAKRPKALFSAPLIAFLAAGENLPLVIALMFAWNFSSRAGEIHVDEFVDHVRHTADEIIESKMDSIMDSALQKMKAVYAHALSTAKSGSSVEAQVADEEYFEQVKLMSFWTESVAAPFHYEMVHTTFECNGHIVGTGYNYEKKEYIAWYTDMHYSHHPFTSTNNVVYETDGCNTADLVGTSTQETTYRTIFTDKDGWRDIEEEDFTAHGTKSYTDGRADPNYIAAKSSDYGCAWSKVFVGLEPPYHLSKTVANVIIDIHDHMFGTVSATILLDEVSTMIDEISATQDTLSMIIVDGIDDKVVAASEGNNAHPITSSCTGEKEVELYTMVEYADVVKVDSGNRYNYLLTYMNDHPEFYANMDDHVADISDEDVHHYYSTHGTFITTSGEIMLLSGIHVIDKCGLDYTLYIILSEAELINEILVQNELAHQQNLATTRDTLLGVFLSCAFCSMIGFALARAISTPLRVIRKDIMLVSDLDFSGSLMRFRPFVTELKMMIDQYMKLKLTLLDFNCFVPGHLLSELVELGDQAIERTAIQRDIAVLFVYVSNFSAASHNSEANLIADFANQFIGGAVDHINNMRGTVIDFFGESIFGIFNAPYDDPDYVKNTMECAHEIISLFQRIKAEFMANNPDFSLIDVRIGVHCGSALVGKIGSTSRLKYCAVGDTVNLGSRIENMNRRYGSNLVCSSDFLEALNDTSDHYCSRPMEYVKVQGRSQPVLLYEISGMINSVENATLTEFKDHTNIFFAVRAGKAGSEEIEAHIKKYGGNSTFLRSALVDLWDLKEVKKLE